MRSPRSEVAGRLRKRVMGVVGGLYIWEHGVFGYTLCFGLYIWWMMRE